VDFGTSHTVAAWRKHNEDPKAVKLLPELSSRQHKRLSLHISENWNDSSPNIKDEELWRPTYIVEDNPGNDVAKSLLPSELISVKALGHVVEGDIENWIPLTDYAIPVMKSRRKDLPDHILAGFKVKSQRRFMNSSTTFKEIYLGMALELFVADLANFIGSLPSEIEITFTYPLRSAWSSEIDDFRDSIQKIITRSGSDFGCSFNLVKGKGLYSESHAAKGGTGVPAQIVMVGDLGGGTLDLLISADDRFKEVADSVRIGGDELLEIIAKNAKFLLPKNGNWHSDPDKCKTQLRAWMRCKGASELFGEDAEKSEDKGLDLMGFEKTEEAAKLARRLIDRYFSIITEYMARSLVAYISKDIETSKSDIQKMDIIVRLRGNG